MCLTKIGRCGILKVEEQARIKPTLPARHDQSPDDFWARNMRAFFGISERTTKVDARARILEALGRTGISVRALARLCGVSHPLLGRYLKGQKGIADAWKIADTAQDLADYIERVQAQTGMRPDVRDIDALRAAIARLRAEREKADEATWALQRLH